ncbi:MAG TPA: DUF5666 domain-containing protein [Ktedonobacteraceae bacterium]|nr:DUF5666 domain-containing protein [Ktedonobacteraceae bacterium]
MEKINRKLFIIIGVLVIIVLGLGAAAVVAVIAHANASDTSTAGATPTVTASALSTGTTATKPKSRRIVGTIQSINGQAIVIVPGKGGKKPVTVMLTSTTKYKTSTGKASPGDLQVGQAVQVTATLNSSNGELDATRIVIQTASATPAATP